MSVNLNADEKILYTANKHWFSLFWPIVLTIFTGGLLFPWVIYALLRFLWDEIIVTNKKVYIRTGVISKSVVTTPIEKVNNIHIHKGLIGRMLDYGTIVIQSGATLGASGYSYIQTPEELQQAIECKSVQG
jgi:membrane protein YdbS with pleckstrin-like domain